MCKKKNCSKSSVFKVLNRTWVSEQRCYRQTCNPAPGHLVQAWSCTICPSEQQMHLRGTDEQLNCSGLNLLCLLSYLRFTPMEVRAELQTNCLVWICGDYESWWWLWFLEIFQGSKDIFLF